MKLPPDAFGEEGTDDQHKPDPHVEDAVHLRILDLSQSLQPGEDGRNLPRAFLDTHAAVMRQDARDVLGEAAAGDVGDRVDDAFDFVVGKDSSKWLGVNACRFE